MMICKTWVKSFDVLNKNRMTIMTSVDGATQLVDDVRSGEGKGDPLLTKNHQQKKNCHPEKQFTATNI